MVVVCYEHKFIFVKTQKTAGTSIETDLSKIAGDSAIVSPVFPTVPGHEPRNFDQGDDKAFYNHMTATAIRKALGTQAFDGMYRFCVEREPVDKCISHFHMLRNSTAHGTYDSTWDEYCREGRFPVDFGKYTERRNGALRLLVDRVIRYDRLEQELAEVMETVGVSDFKLRTRAKSNYRARTLVRREDVTPQQKALIQAAFQPTLDATGIDWDDNCAVDATLSRKNGSGTT